MKQALLLLAFFTATNLLAENATIKDVLAGKVAPLSLKLGDLNREWSRLSIGTKSAPDVMGGSRAYLAMMLGGSFGDGACYTRGDTVSVEGETFLIVYRLVSKPIDMSVMMRGGPNALPAPEKPTPDSALSLSLVHLRMVEGLSSIRPFDLEVELAGGDASDAALEEARESAAKARGLQNLRQIGLGLLAYAQDGDKTLPAMKDAEEAGKALAPYCKNKDVFTSPDTKQLYTPNASLSGRKLAEIAGREGIAAFYDAKPVNGSRGVVFLDGHVERVPEAKWPNVKQASQIP
jgi:prepilin-type processing-associated H-X9-DG protein